MAVPRVRFGGGSDELFFLFFVFWKFRPNLRGGNSYHSSFDDPLGKGAAHEADVTTR